jgi:hypothetical protein
MPNTWVSKHAIHAFEQMECTDCIWNLQLYVCVGYFPHPSKKNILKSIFFFEELVQYVACGVLLSDEALINFHLQKL